MSGFLQRLLHPARSKAPYWIKSLARTFVRWGQRRKLAGVLPAHNRPKKVLQVIGGIGDSLMATVVAHEMVKTGESPPWLLSDHTEIFEGNPDFARVIPINSDLGRLMMGGLPADQIVGLSYQDHDLDTDTGTVPDEHVIAKMCRAAGIEGSIDLLPRFALRDVEKASFAGYQGSIAIQSAGTASLFPIPNREWFPDRFQSLVDAFSSQYNFVQVGAVSDPLLQGVSDLRGKTDLRGLASLLSQCRLYVGAVGLMMHLARAVECPSVIIYGGREAPWQSGYGCNSNVSESPPCAPCWRYYVCGHDHICMTSITAERVIDAIKLSLAKPRSPLPVDSVTLQAAA